MERVLHFEMNNQRKGEKTHVIQCHGHGWCGSQKMFVLC